jgi:hypothetical protein
MKTDWGYVKKQISFSYFHYRNLDRMNEKQTNHRNESFLSRSFLALLLL